MHVHRLHHCHTLKIFRFKVKATRSFFCVLHLIRHRTWVFQLFGAGYMSAQSFCVVKSCSEIFWIKRKLCQQFADGRRFPPGFRGLFSLHITIYLLLRSFLRSSHLHDIMVCKLAIDFHILIQFFIVKILAVLCVEIAYELAYDRHEAYIQLNHSHMPPSI